MARQKWCSACINSFVSAEICKLILRSRQYLFFPVWCRTFVHFLTIIIVWLFFCGSSETMLSLHKFLCVLCLDSIYSFMFHVESNICIIFTRELQQFSHVRSPTSDVTCTSQRHAETSPQKFIHTTRICTSLVFAKWLLSIWSSPMHSSLWRLNFASST